MKVKKSIEHVLMNSINSLNGKLFPHSSTPKAAWQATPHCSLAPTRR
jgi:hypothetical protein